MKIQKYIKSIGFRIVAIAVAVSLPFTEVSAYALETSTPARLSTHITIPNELGTIDKKQQGEKGGDRIVIHIQDAHGQLGAQQNIQKLLDYLARQYGFKTVFLEGGLKGTISPHLLRFFQDEELNEKIASRLLEKGEIGGPEVFLLKSQGKVKAYGVEESGLYKDNLSSFRKVYSGKTISHLFLQKLEAKINLVASHLSSPTLQKFLKDWLLYQNDKKDMLSHLNMLGQYAQEILRLDLTDPRHQERYPQLVRYFKLKEMETGIQAALKTNRLEKEKDELLRWAQEKKINPDLALRMKAVLTERGEADTFEDLRIFVEHFYEEVHAFNFTFDRYPNVCLYLGSLILRQELESLDLFEETDAVTRALLAALAKTEKEKMLIEIIRDLRLLTKLFSLELSRSEWREVSLRRSAVSPDAFQSRLFAITEKKIETRFRFPPALDLVFREALRFYELAEARDLSISESIIQTLDEQDIQKAILITGGFHTEGIEKFLGNHNIGLLEITPKMGTLQTRSAYLKQMLFKPPSISMVKPISPGDMSLPVMRTEMGDRLYMLHRNILIETIGTEARERNNLSPGPGLREQGLTLEEAVPTGFGAKREEKPEEKAFDQLLSKAARLSAKLNPFVNQALAPDREVFDSLDANFEGFRAQVASAFQTEALSENEKTRLRSEVDRLEGMLAGITEHKPYFDSIQWRNTNAPAERRGRIPKDLKFSFALFSALSVPFVVISIVPIAVAQFILEHVFFYIPFLAAIALGPIAFRSLSFLKAVLFPRGNVRVSGTNVDLFDSQYGLRKIVFTPEAPENILISTPDKGIFEGIQNFIDRREETSERYKLVRVQYDSLPQRFTYRLSDSLEVFFHRRGVRVLSWLGATFVLFFLNYLTADFFDREFLTHGISLAERSFVPAHLLNWDVVIVNAVSHRFNDLRQLILEFLNILSKSRQALPYSLPRSLLYVFANGINPFNFFPVAIASALITRALARASERNTSAAVRKHKGGGVDDNGSVESPQQGFGAVDRKEWVGKIKYRFVYFALLNLLAIPLTIALPVRLLEWAFGSSEPNTKSQLIMAATAIPIAGWAQHVARQYAPQIFPSFVRTLAQKKENFAKLIQKSMPTLSLLVPIAKIIPRFIYLWLPALFFFVLHFTETYIPILTWVQGALVVLSVTTLLLLDHRLEGKFPSLRVSKKPWVNWTYRIIEKLPAWFHFTSLQFYYMPLFFFILPWSVEVTNGKIRVHGLGRTPAVEKALAETLRGIPSVAGLNELFFYPWPPPSLTPAIAYYENISSDWTRLIRGAGDIVIIHSPIQRGVPDLDATVIPHEFAHWKYFSPSFSPHLLRWEEAYKKYREDTRGFHLRDYSLKDKWEGFAVWFEHFYTNAGYDLSTQLDRADEAQREMWLVAGQALLEDLDGKPHLKINFLETKTHWLIPVRLDDNGWLTMDELKHALDAAREKQLSFLSEKISLPMDLNTLERTLKSENDEKKLLYLSLVKLATPEILAGGSLIQTDEAKLTEMLRTFALERLESSTAKDIALHLLEKTRNARADNALEKVLLEHTRIPAGPGQWILQPVNFSALNVVESLEHNRAGPILTRAIEKLQSGISDWQAGAVMVRLLAGRNQRTPEDKATVERILALHENNPSFQTEAGHLAEQYLREINAKEETDRPSNSGFGVFTYPSSQPSQETINIIAISVAGKIWKESPPTGYFVQSAHPREYASLLGIPSQATQEPAQISVSFLDAPAAKDPRVDVLVNLLARNQRAQVRIEVPGNTSRLDLEKEIRASVLDLRTSLGIPSKNVAMHVVSAHTDISKFISNRYVRTLVYDPRRDVLGKLGRNNRILRVENNMKAGTPLDLEALALLNAIDQVLIRTEFPEGIQKALDLLKITENMEIRMRAEFLFKQAA